MCVAYFGALGYRQHQRPYYKIADQSIGAPRYHTTNIRNASSDTVTDIAHSPETTWLGTGR